MITRALLVRLTIKHGMDAEAEEFLSSALPLVQAEAGTAAWFAIRFGRSEYGIFDAFPDEAAREAHLSGAVAQALRENSERLFAEPPHIEKIDVLSDKMPLIPLTAPITKALLLTFKAHPGHEQNVEEFLRNAKELVEQEPKTVAWFALQLDAAHYGIFDVFPDHSGRFTHITGHVPRELTKHALSLLGGLPDLELPSVLTAKLAPIPAAHASH